MTIKAPAVLRKPRRPRATIDFEGRSGIDIKKVGAWLYSTHPTTEPHCLAYHLPGMDPAQPKLWHRAYPAIGLKETPMPEDLFRWIESGGYVEAHNAGFELAFWQNQMVENYFWPAVDDEQWLCSAAKASALALPRNLEDLADALELNTRKLAEEGKHFIKTYCKPRRLNKQEKAEYGPNAILFNEDVVGLRKGFQYCRGDVTVEIAASNSTDDLSTAEESLWRTTMRMNKRGVYIDTELARSALVLAAKAKNEANEELEAITRNTPCGNEEEGLRGGQREALKAWLLANEDLELADTKAKTLEWYTDPKRGPEMSDRARRVLTIIREVNRTSTNKYKRMLERVDSQGVARELMVYCGAERTGRFSSSGIQIHNLPKGRFDSSLFHKDEKDKIIDYAVADVKTRDLEWCKMIYGDVMNLVASCLRGSIIAGPGQDLMTADYSAIEARVVLWLAGAIGALDVFYRGDDIYCDMASGIYGREITKATAKVISSMGATERDFGKVAILGLGYNMGWLKFLISMRSYNIVLTRDEVLQAMGKARLEKYEKQVLKALFPKLSHFGGDLKKFRAAEREAAKNRASLLAEREDPLKVIHELALCKYTVETYRARYKEVPKMWRSQEAAAIEAVATGNRVRCGKVVWFVKGRFLKCRLPGGRCLNYASPRLVQAKTSWGESKPSLRFMGRDQKTGRWSRQATYGGKLVENITQATARDIMGYAKLELEKNPDYALLMSVHDEIVAAVDENGGDAKEFARIMSTLPPAYDGCPIAAEPQRYKRYRK